jgi:DnaJ-class molecular chaperone
MPLRNHYGVLNVDARASTEAIKKAYKALAIELHPDLNFGCKEKEQKFKRVTEAYHVLVDGSRRREYDLEHGLERKSSFYHGQASGGSFYYGSTRPRESPLYTAPPPPGQRPFDTEVSG